MIFGWVPNPLAVERGLAKYEEDTNLHSKVIKAADNILGSWDGKTNVCLWEACKKINGGINLPADKQTIGDCTSHGGGRGKDYLTCVEIAISNMDFEWEEGRTSCFTEALYGMAREIANMLGNEDGCYGQAIVEALRKGVVGRQGRSYDGNRAKQWGRTGTPQDVKDQGTPYPVEQYAQVTDVEHAADLIFNGYPIPVASDQGFNMTRDSDGFCRAQGSWGHEMCFIGVIVANGKKGLTCLQSWGQNTPEGPTILGMPDNSFNVEFSVADRMLKQNDSFALNSTRGYQRRNLPFYV